MLFLFSFSLLQNNHPIMLWKDQFQMNTTHAHVLCIQGKNWTINEYMQMKQLINRCSITKVARYNVMVFLLMMPYYLVFLLWFSRTGFPGRPANKSRLIPAIWNVTQVTVCRRKKQERRLKPPPSPLPRMQIKLDQSQPPWLYTVLYNDGILDKQTRKKFFHHKPPSPQAESTQS